MSLVEHTPRTPKVVNLKRILQWRNKLVTCMCPKCFILFESKRNIKRECPWCKETIVTKQTRAKRIIVVDKRGHRAY